MARPNVLQKLALTLLLASAGPVGVAAAQDTQEPSGGASAGEPAADPPADPPTDPPTGPVADEPGSFAQGVGGADPGEAPPEQAGQAGPTLATTSVVIDERQTELDREQAEMEAQAEASGDMVVDRDLVDRDLVDGDLVDEGENGLNHEFQLGLRVGFGVPFIFALRYGSGAPCNDTPAGMDVDTFCLHVGSAIVDADVSFGVTPDLEITLLGRFGMVGVQPSQSNIITLGLGFRSYLEPDSLFKLYLGARVLLDITDGTAVSDWSDVDFGVRGEVGLQLDIVRFLGLFIEVGVGIFFVRSFMITPDVTGGVQVRFP